MPTDEKGESKQLVCLFNSCTDNSATTQNYNEPNRENTDVNGEIR